MTRIVSLAAKLRDDQSGASFLEYTVLLGILLAGAIGTIIAVGTWTSGQWTALNAVLPAP